MKTLLWSLALLLVSFSASSQSAPVGSWEGFITVGGLHSNQGYKFELVLEGNGRRLSGRTYIHMNDGQVLAMDVVGKMYKDRSVYLQEVRVVQLENGIEPDFSRKYQMVYKRGLYENAIEGFWQEIRPDISNAARERGRITLKKVKKSKA